MAKLFGTDGIRGIANSELDCELALCVGRAVAAVVTDDSSAHPTVVLGCDTRASSDMLCAAVTAGLCSAGVDVIDLGTLSTPAVAYLTAKYEADAGIMISASHNPPQFNGIKVIGKGGLKLPDAREQLIEELISDPSKIKLAPGHKVGRRRTAVQAACLYIDHILSSANCSFSGLRIAIDCAHGAACSTVTEIFGRTDAELHLLNNAPDGTNINQNCGSTDMQPLAKYVVEHGLDCGIAFDGDADRCLLIDERGNEVDGDAILAMCALDMYERGSLCGNTVVGTVMSNMGLGKFCEANGLEFIATKVGDRYVLEQMLEHGYSLGGEQSGHIIFRDYATTGDGQLTAIQVLSLMTRRGQSLSELASIMPHYPQSMINVTVTPEGKARLDADPLINSTIDDIRRRLGDHGRILVRVSGTEPLIRVMVEGEDAALTRCLAEQAADVIRQQLS